MGQCDTTTEETPDPFAAYAKTSLFIVWDYFNPPKIAFGSELRPIPFCRLSLLYFPSDIPLPNHITNHFRPEEPDYLK